MGTSDVAFSQYVVGHEKESFVKFSVKIYAIMVLFNRLKIPSPVLYVL